MSPTSPVRASRRRRILTPVALLLSLLLATACTSTGVSDPNSNNGNQQAAPTAAGSAPSASNGSGTSTAGQPQGPFPKHPDGKLKIGWVELTADCQSCVKALNSFNDYIKNNNKQWELSTLNSKGDPQGVASAIEDFTTRKVDAIVVAFAVMNASGTAIQAANAANIPVFTLDSGWTPGVVGDITTNNFAMAGSMASYVADRLGGKGNVLIIWSDQHYGVVIRREMMEAVTKTRYPGIKILDEKNVTLAGYFQESTNAAEDWASRFKGQIDAVYCGFDEPCEAAAQVFQKAGINVPMFGFDGHEQAMDLIRNGNGQSGLVATQAQQFGPFADTVGKWIQDIMVDGKPVAQEVPVPEIYLPSKLITKANVPPVGTAPWLVPDFYANVSGIGPDNR